ncbi:hypothetical protein ACVWZL_005414 [Bradyrhizobium sp. GM2.4]
MHTACHVDGSYPPPAVCLGTTAIRSLVIMLRMAGARLPKGCAKHSGQRPDVKAMRPFPRDFGSVAVFPGLGER